MRDHPTSKPVLALDTTKAEGPSVRRDGFEAMVSVFCALEDSTRLRDIARVTRQVIPSA